jgi:DNA-binding transcriptional regulator PaaX
MQGWIKLHRSLIEWEWIQDPKVLQVFILCLLKANHKEKTWQGHTIKKGQFVSGRRQLAVESGQSEQSVRTALKKLQKSGELTIKSTNSFSFITLNNWELYQGEAPETNQPANQQITNNQPATNQQLTTTKNAENGNNAKKKGGTHLDAQELGQFQDVWMDYLQHRKELKIKAYASATSEQKALNKLIDMASNDPEC